MTYLKIVIDIIGVGLEAVTISSFLKMVMRKRNIPSVSYFLGYIAFFLLFSIVLIFVKNGIVLMTLVYLAILTISFMYKTSFVKRILFSAILTILLLLSEFVIGLIVSAVTKLPVQDVQNNVLMYLICVLISKLMLLIFIKASGHYIRPHDLQIAKPLLVVLLVLPIATFFMVLSVSMFSYSSLNLKSLTLVIISAILLIIVNILIFYMFEWQLNQAEKINKEKILKTQTQLQMEYLKSTLEKKEISNKIFHDLKHQLLAVTDMITSENKDGIAQLIKISDFITKDMCNEFTQVPEVNALLNSEYEKMKDLNIKFTCKSLLPHKLTIDIFELMIVIGNLLDNAIEACEKCEKNIRKIDVEFKQSYNYLTIVVSNSVSGVVNIIDKKIQTTKNNSEIHGFGLNSIKEVVAKYNGNVFYSQKEGEFLVNIIMENTI